MTDDTQPRRRWRWGALIAASTLGVGGIAAVIVASEQQPDGESQAIVFNAGTTPPLVTAPRETPTTAPTAPGTAPPSTSASSAPGAASAGDLPPTDSVTPSSTGAEPEPQAPSTADSSVPDDGFGSLSLSDDVPVPTIAPRAAPPSTSEVQSDGSAPTATADLPPVVVTIENGLVAVSGAVRDLPAAQSLVDQLRFRTGTDVDNRLTVDSAAREVGVVPVFVPGAALFLENGATMTGRSEEILTIVARLVAAGPGQRLLIRGHTDDVGSDAYNFALSQQRIAAVFAFLQSQGVSADVMQLEPRGETEPIADNATAEGRARNRRVELILVAA